MYEGVSERRKKTKVKTPRKIDRKTVISLVSNIFVRLKF